MARQSHDRRLHAAQFVPALVALFAFAAFLPALGNGFVDWDDQKNFLDNPHYRGLGLSQLRWMWSTFHMGHYVPLSWMSLGLDYTLWGMNPVGYHLTNLLIHAANAVLVYFVARRLFPRRDDRSLTNLLPPAAAGLFFALHPLRVESVAWITERRDVLSLLFFLSSILAYLRSTDASAYRPRWYWASVGLFASALLSKATAMSLPAVLLILNLVPLGRIGGATGWWSDAARRVYRELIPFAILAAATVVLSIVALHPPDQLNAVGKAAVSSYSLSFYLWKTIAPLRLSPLYEMPQQLNPFGARFLVGYVVVVASVAALWWARTRWPKATAAFVAFLVISLPMLGVVQNGPQLAADRYTYHSAPALALLAAAGLVALHRVSARLRALIGAAVLAVLGGLTWRQTTVWHDSERLWTYALSVNDESAIAHSALANQLFKRDRLQEGMDHSARAVALAPNYAEAHNDLGVGLARQGRFADAIHEYERALAIQPVYDEAENNLGVAVTLQGDPARGVQHYRQALAVNPDNPDAHVNWGNAMVRDGKPAAAIDHYREALAIRPNHADAHHNWGVALARQGKFAEAIEQFRIVLAIDASHAEAREYLQKAIELSKRP